MKLTINIPKKDISPLCNKISKWKELSPSPLTNLKELQQLEKDISSLLTSIILSSNTLDDVLIKI